MILRGKKVLVTGGAGFLGKRVTKLLRGMYCSEVIVPRSSRYDLTREIDVACLMARERPDIVIHLAAVCGGIGANRDRPGTFFHDNMAMGLNVVHEATFSGVEKIVLVGTVCSYPKFTVTPFREDDLWAGYPEETNAPYGLAKRVLIVMANAYREQYGTNIIYLIPANLYGPGDNFDPHTSHVIPAIIRKCVEAVRSGADEVVLWGTGTPTREFLYVDDAANGIVTAAEKYDDTDPVNLGTGNAISILRLTKTISALVGFTGRLTWDSSQPNGQPKRRLDISRAKETFGWEAKVKLEDGLRQTIDWYMNHEGDGHGR